jgi:flavodoxin
MKTLVVYYSLEGNTKRIAELIHQKYQGDLLELIPEKENPKEGFGKYFWGGKSVIFKESPKLISALPDPKDYDLIFIGSPLWAGSYAPSVHTLLNTVSFEGKNLALFICHSGGGTESTLNNFKKQLPKSKLVGFHGFKDPLAQDPKAVDQELSAWLSDIKVA